LQVGDLDERFAIYYNDMDWCFRMKAAGWSIRYTPDAEVEHHLGQTVGSVNRDFRYFAMLHNNVLLFYQKHYGRAAVVLYRLLLACGFVPRLLAWSVASLIRPSPHARHMRQFSAKTLVFGMTFWQPVEVEDL
jgi:GT2 family glycosyltransferase